MKIELEWKKFISITRKRRAFVKVMKREISEDLGVTRCRREGTSTEEVTVNKSSKRAKLRRK